MRKNYKALGLDIDGTLTNSEKIITPETKEAVIKLQQEGIHVIIASGRSEYGVRHLADELKFDEFGSYVMSFNGGRISNYKTGEKIYDNALPLEIIPEIYDLVKKLGLGILGYEKDNLISGNGVDKYQEYDAWACKMNLKPVDNFPVYFSESFNKCLLTGEPDKLRESLECVKDHFKDRLNVFLSEEFFIEVLPFGVHKAAGFPKLLERLGITKDELVCVGDGLNDVTMIEYAGLGVAMKNANKALFPVADYVTDSNDENGVLKVIEKFF